MGERLECIEKGPADAETAVLWLHGLGASGDDFVPLVPHLGLPRTRFIFPHAPVRPVTINMGYRMRAWYDITTLERSATREPEADIRASAEMVEALLEREAERGRPAHKVVLAGFSQGGAMALHVGIRHAHGLAGIMVLSAYALLTQTLGAEAHPANAQTPMLFCHGTHDPLVGRDRGREAYDLVSEGRPARWEEYPMEHEVCPAEVATIKSWLHARLSG